MPLSEHEQRILHDIERRLYDSDPGSARRLGGRSPSSCLAWRCTWSALGFLAGLVILVASLSSSWPVALFGFVVALASAVVLVESLRRLLRLKWVQSGPGPAGERLADLRARRRRPRG